MIGLIKDPFLPKRLRFFRERPLKVNSDGIRFWKFFSMKKILKKTEEMIIRWSKVRTILSGKTSQENSSNFSRVRKDVSDRGLS